MAEQDDQELRNLNAQITRLQQSMLQLANSQQVGSAEWNRIQTQLAAVQQRYRAIIESQQKFANSVGKGTAALGKMAVGAVKVGSDFATAASAVRQGRENFNSLNPSINVAGSALRMTGKLAGVAGDALGGLASGIPLVGGVLGGAISAVGKFAAAISDAVATIITTIGPHLTGEIQRATEAYQRLGQVGGLTAKGLTGLMEESIDAGLSFTQFSSVASKGAEGLAYAFGDASAGIRRFSEVSKDMEPFRQGLLSLGIGAEKQNELTSKYLLLQARTGRVETMSAKALAQGSEEYIRKLSTLSRITGKSVDEAQSIMDAQTRNIRLMGAAADVQERIGGEAGKRAALAMQTTSAAIESVASKEIADGLRDAMAGSYNTEAAQGFILAAGRDGANAVDALRAGTISDLAATQLIMQGINKQFDALGGPGGIARLADIGTPMDSVFEGMFNVAQRAQLTAEDFKDLQTAQGKLTTTTDTTTADMISAQIALQQAAIEADKMAKELMGPAASAVKQFAEIVAATNADMLKLVKLFGEGGLDAIKNSIAGQLNGDTTNPYSGEEFDPTAPGAWEKYFSPGYTVPGSTDTQGLTSDDWQYARDPEAEARLAESQAKAAERWENISKMFSTGFGLFSGKAGGGTVSSDETYLVGENGPELFKPKRTGNIVPNENLAQNRSSATPDYGKSNLDLARILQSSRDGIGALTGASATNASMAGPGGTLRSEEFSSAFAENLDISKEHLANVKSDTLMRKEISDLTIEKLTEIVTAMDRANSTSEKILRKAQQG